MLKYGNKEIRNLQEQVEENMKNIQDLMQGQVVLDEFGIKVVGEIASIDDLPTVADYKEEHEDWSYGDAYAIGEETPYSLYILTRGNNENPDDYWFDIGVFPMPGPQGEQGPRGETGPQGQTGATGEQGASAGFGTITATAETLSPGSSATATVVASGPDTAKELSFTFGLPQGESAAFTHYITITASTIVGSQITGTLSLNEYNILYNNYDSVVRLRSSGSLANLYYFLKKWSVNDDYMRYVGLWSLNNVTRYFLFTVDRSNRKWTLDVGQPVKVLVSASDVNSGAATNGQVLTADGNGGASWQNAAAGSDVVTLTTTVGNLSNDDYNKVAGNNCVIIYDDNTTKVYFKKYDETSTTITYATPYSEGSSTYVYGVGITKATKYYQIQSAYMPISNSNIKSGSTIADKYLKTNGSGGAVWGDAPSQVQSDWNESNQSSPAYIKNKPTIPTVPVTDVTVNGTSVMDGTTAKVLVDTVDGATDGTNWTSLTINGTTSAIPAAQVQANWNESDINDPSYIRNKPTLATVATSGSYNDLTNKPTIPSVSGSYSGDYWTSINLNGTSKSLVAAGALHYQGQVGTSADITWTNLISSSKSVKAGDFWYVKTARVLGTPTASTGNLLIATTDGTGTSTTWKVLPTTDKTGTVKSVRVQATSPVQSSVSTEQSSSLNTTISLASGYGDTQNPYGSKTANYVLAAPNGSAGTPSFRALVKADLPTLTASDVGALPDSTVIPDAVSGTNDGTNWTSLTIGSDTYNIGGGSTPSNMVTTDTDQTITGVKTFNANIQMQGGKILYLADPSADTYLRRWSGNGRIIIMAPNTTKNPEIGPVLAAGGGGLMIECNNNGVGWTFDEKSLYNDSPSTTHNLGTSANKIQDIYMAGNLSDGTNSISVANMVGKSTVSGTNDGTNWTSLTVDGVTKSIPAGGGSQKYKHCLTLWFYDDGYGKSASVTFEYISTSARSMAQNGSNINSLPTTITDILTTYGCVGTSSTLPNDPPLYLQVVRVGSTSSTTYSMNGYFWYVPGNGCYIVEPRNLTFWTSGSAPYITGSATKLTPSGGTSSGAYCWSLTDNVITL